MRVACLVLFASLLACGSAALPPVEAPVVAHVPQSIESTDYLLANATVLGEVDVARVLSSPYFSQLAEGPPVGRLLQMAEPILAKSTRLYFSYFVEGDVFEAVFVLEGEATLDEVASLAPEDATARADHNGVPALSYENELLLAQPRPGLIVAGTTSAVRTVLSTPPRVGFEPVRPLIEAFARDLPSAAVHLYAGAVARESAMRENAGNNADIEDIQGIAFALDVSEGGSLRVLAQLDDDAAAERFRALLDGARAAVLSQTVIDRFDLRGPLENMRLERSAGDVRVALDMPDTAIQGLIGLLSQVIRPEPAQLPTVPAP